MHLLMDMGVLRLIKVIGWVEGEVHTGSFKETRIAPKPGMDPVKGLNTILAVPCTCQFFTCTKSKELS
jgi:hypothetical protein